MSRLTCELLDVSPVSSPHGHGRNKENSLSVPVLSLVQFSRPPFVSFGTVKVGSSKSVLLRIVNPVNDTTEVRVEKIASSKGFHVERTLLTIQPDENADLPITWTPVEDGGVREVITFIANGIVKHQAVLHGKAEALKRKKKSLWESIKNKKSSDISNPCKRKTSSLSLKNASNKTFLVPRHPEYKRGRTRGPLESLNKELDVVNKVVSSPTIHNDPLVQGNVTPVSLHSNLDSQLCLNKDSPMVFLVPSAKLVDATVTDKNSADVDHGPNSTHPCVNSPHFTVSLTKPLVDSCNNLTSDAKKCISPNKTFLSDVPVLSVKDALAIIQSDLETGSPPNACSSYDFSDSLESSKGNTEDSYMVPVACKQSEQRAVPDLSFDLDPVKARLTFCVKSDAVPQYEGAGKATDEDPSQKPSRIKFTSATVTKTKCTQAGDNALEARKTKTSQRRLLEKTAELLEDNCKSDKVKEVLSLPVIDSPDELDSPLQNMTTCLSPIALCGVSPITVCPPPVAKVVSHTSEMTFTSTQPAGLSVCHQQQSDCNNKKRKSEEFVKDDSDPADDSFQVKRIRPFQLVKEHKTSLLETRVYSKSTCKKLHKTSTVRKSQPAAVKTSSGVPQSRLSSAKSARQGSQSVKAAGKLFKPKVVAVAQAQLTFIKPAQTVIPRHPMPFAAKNMFYDERWIEKQERGFTFWINYVLTPDDFRVNTEVAKVNAMSCLAFGTDQKFSISKAPTKEQLSFRTYTARSRLNRLRRTACQLFTSEAMVKGIQRLELEVESRRLLMRKDRPLWKDIGQRQKVLNWLLSYNPLWLRIGLETIFGELIPLESNNDVMGLAMFILNRLLWSPDIAAEYRHPTVPHLYRNGHDEALSSFTVKKLLLLVCFLDKAKECRIIDHDPCLFCMNAEFKSTKDLLLAFARDFLSGEGILSRHLALLGLPVSHKQTPLDEFDFAVKTLAVDLKCGIRLVRVMELFTQNWNLSTKLRMPAVSRLQKVHNVELALQALKANGVDLTDDHGGAIDARDIVDGHREKTLSLLWKIIFAFQVDVLLNEEQLREEICFLQRMWKNKQELMAHKASEDAIKAIQKTAHTFQHSNTKVVLLMDWVNAVCTFYNAKTENFTVSFSDGQVFCYLVHHYHPCHLPLEAICQQTTQTVECGLRGSVELDCSLSDSENSFNDSPTRHIGVAKLDFKELLENELCNFKLLNTAVSSLGAVPAMINPLDMSNTIPNEKVVLCYLSFLCARLLELRTEMRAAWIIQGVWRKYKMKKNEKILKERNIAATKIQVAVRTFLQKRHKARQSIAALVIQAVWRGYLVRREVRLKMLERLRILQDGAATVIQAQWRKYVAVKHFQQLRYHTIALQALIRMKLAMSAYKRIQWAVTTIQKRRQACILGREEHCKYLLLRNATLVIQKCFQRWKTRSSLKRNCAARIIQVAYRKWQERKTARWNAAALKIQSWYRMKICQRHYETVLQKTVSIQSWWRGVRERQKFICLKRQSSAALVIQSMFRTYFLKRQFGEMRHSAILIQRWYRASLQGRMQRLQYQRIKLAALTLQAAFRGHVVRKTQKNMHKAVTVIQAAVKTFVARRRYIALKKATIAIQQRYRAKMLRDMEREAFLGYRQAVLKVQALWRGKMERKRYQKLHNAAVVIQSYYRMHVVQSHFRVKKKSTLLIQQQYRAHLTGKKVRLECQRIKEAVIILQAAFRATKIRLELQKKQNAAILIQATFKGFMCRQNFVALKKAAVVVQVRYRAQVIALRQQSRYDQIRQAALKLQAAYRGWKVRRRLQNMRKASTVIQAYFRMYKRKVIFLAAKCAAGVIQQRYRAYVKGRQQRKAYLEKRDCVVVIQSAFRGLRTRLHIQKMHQAAIIIQAYFRRHQQIVRYRRFCWAASVICQRFRAIQARNVEVREYTALRNAAICIQSSFRGMKARKQVKKMHRAAHVIQRRYLVHKERRRFLGLKAAAIKIQQKYRATCVAKLQQKQFLSLLNASNKIQAYYRGWKVRKDLQKRHQAATVFQASFRMYQRRMAFQAMKQAAIILQRHVRNYLKAKQERAHFLKLRYSAMVIQAAYRGKRTRREVTRMHLAAIVLQAQFRMRRQQKSFKRTQMAVEVLQDHYKACRLRNSAMKSYRAKKAGAIVIQRAFRYYRARQALRRIHSATVLIQSTFRRFQIRSNYVSLKAACVVVQRKYRAMVASRVQRAEYLKMRIAIVSIQAAFRGMRDRRHLQREHRAAEMIQAQVRMHLAKSYYKRLQKAAKVIQVRYRANMLMRAETQSLQVKKQAIVRIQAAFRGMKERQQIKRERNAASRIQKYFRNKRARKQYLSLRSTVLTMQQRFRATILARQQRERYQRVRRAVVILQATWRGWRARKLMQQQHEAATLIQASFRRYKNVVKYQAMRLSTLTIQMYYRSYLRMKQERENFLELKASAITIQAAFRRHWTQKEVARWHKSATVIQAAFRMHSQKKAFKRLQWATGVCQQRFRAQRLRDVHLKQYWLARSAAICLQSAFRGKLARQRARRMKAAVKVQSVLRMVVSRQKFVKIRASAVKLQASFRSLVARRRFTRYQQAALTLQSHYRAWRDMHNQRVQYLDALKSIRVIQQRWRGRVERRKFRQIRRSATTIQSFYRGMVQRRMFKQQKASVATIEEFYKMYAIGREERSKYLKLKKSAVFIQALWRGHLARQRFKKNRAAVRIQAWFRGNVVRHNLKRRMKAMATIHRCVQTRWTRNRYLKMRQSACIIQRRWRETLKARMERQRFLNITESAVRIQAFWRGRRERLDLQKKQRAACLIQSVYRGYVQRRAFLCQRRATVALQTRFRALQSGRKEREKFISLKAATVTLQAFCRGWIVRQSVRLEAQVRKRKRFSAAAYHNLCAVRIQRALRAHWALESAKKQLFYVIYIQRLAKAWIQRKRYLADRENILKVQRAVRTWLSRRNKAATTIQKAIRNYQRCRQQQKAQHGVVKMQALWRGHRSRQLNDTAKIVAMRNHFKEVNMAVKEEDKLCNKTSIAIDYLLRYKHFSYILAALKHLETSTRLSPKCCEHLVRSGATLVIFTLIRNCNRSVPCMEVITYAIQVLLNLSKYDKTTEAVYEVENSVDTLLELLQIYREKAGDKVAQKGGSIFSKVCLLLTILMHDNQRAQEIINIPKAVDRITSIHRLTVRKHKKDAERTLMHQKMNISLNGSFFPPTPSHKIRNTPRFGPDWDLRKDGMKEVVDPLRAIQMVAVAFSVD